jgi:hypothetical protein
LTLEASDASNRKGQAMKRCEREASMGDKKISAKRNETTQAQIDELRASLASLDGNMCVVADALIAGVAANRLILAQLVARNLAITPAGGSADANRELGKFHQGCLGVVNIAAAASSSKEVQKLCEMTAQKIDEFFVEVAAAAQLIDAATDAGSVISKH